MKKRIVCFGDSNTWGFDGETLERFDENTRWTKLLEKLLGEEFEVIEEGLSGRTTVIDDPLFEGLNGYNYIHPCLMSHSPLDLVIIMLGTNDTKERFSLTSYNIAQGIVRIALKAKNTAAGIDGGFPKVLIVLPSPIEKEYINSYVAPSMGKNCDKKSIEMINHAEELLSQIDVEVMVAGDDLSMNTVDYMHLDKMGHKDLAKKVYNKIKDIL